MTTFPETSSFTSDNPKRIQDPNQNPILSTEERQTGKRNMAKLNDEKNEYVQDKQNLKSWKNQEFCKVHETRNPGKNDSRNDNFQNIHQKKSDLHKNVLDDDSDTNQLQSEEPTNFQLTPSISKVSDDHDITLTDVTVPGNPSEINKRDAKTLQTDTNINSHTSNCISEFPEIKLSAKEVEVRSSEKEECLSIPNAEENDTHILEKPNLNSKFSQLPSSLPDILNTIQNTSPIGFKTINNEDLVQNDERGSVDRMNLANEKKSKSVLSQSLYFPHPLSSDSFSNETEAELKKLRTLQSLKANQSIYKLAFDENITDQSNSRSPSPVDPETQVPSSIPNSEILIHEAGSDSEAGSEDVELISHRYESETSLNENKHMYVNKLSLAVELLRTQETLPYDEQFKRVVMENTAKETKKYATGEVNFAFVEDSYTMESLDDHVVVSTPSEAFSYLNNEVSGSCEIAKEVVETVTNPICKMCSVS